MLKLADNGVRGQIPHFMKIVVEQKLEPKYDEQVKEFVLTKPMVENHNLSLTVLEKAG